MRTLERYHAPEMVRKAKVCPKCGEKPLLKKDVLEWVFIFGCRNACALKTDEISISRLAEKDEETFSYELGYGLENMEARLLAWWNEL
jgi:hypothetical protein